MTLAQGLSWNAGLLTQIGNGQQSGNEYNYLENYINTSLEYGHLYLDLSFEYSDPPEYGFSARSFDRFFLSYIGDMRTLEIGDISAVFGRGLALNLDENQAIDFDNEIKGLRFTSALFELNELDFIAGMNKDYRFYSPSSELREPDGQAAYELAGLEVTLNSSQGRWSASPYFIASRMESDYVWRTISPQSGAVNTDTVMQAMHTLQTGWGQSYYGDSWDIYTEYSVTRKALDYPILAQTLLQSDQGILLQNSDKQYTLDAQALNLQINWFPEWFTSLFEYKRYLNGQESSAAKRDPLRLATKPLPWQMGPTGIKEHDISLLGNVTHPVDYGDELGWTLELRKDISERWVMILNAAQTSQAGDDPGFWPTQDLSRNPWQEYFAEFEYAGDAIFQRMLLAYTRNVLSGQSAAEIMDHITVVPAYLSWHPNAELVLSTVIEFQHSRVSGELYEGGALEGHDFNSTHNILSADYRHNYSASLIWDTSNDPGLNEGSTDTQHWLSAEISAKPLDGLWIRTSYGKEKGGVRCTGGVCRVLNPFEGFRMTLEWRL
jgi:hypothetical protein